MLDIADVTPYLLERELIGAQALVDGGLRIADKSRRNRVFVVTADGMPGLVVKQPIDDDAGVRHEAAVLERLRAADTRLAARLPAPVAFDPETCVLVVAAAPDAQDLRERHARGRFSRDLAAQTGRALALLHATPPGTLGDHVAPWDPSWFLRLYRPSLEAAQQMTSAASELVTAVQQSEELSAALDELRAAQVDDVLVHGDMRWDNVLTARAAGGASERRSRVLLIDWESAGRGDPSLDVGGFFGEYLHAWLRSIPIVDAAEPGRLLAHAGRPLARMRPALRAFWLAYARERGAGAAELAELLRRAASYAAVRVMMSAYEESLSRHELRGSARFALALCLNILRRPDDAIARLLGFDSSWTAA